MEVSNLIEDKKFVDYVINKCIPMKKMFDMVGSSYSDSHNVFCPFHENEITPAAKIYHNPDGIDTMFCFTERRVYRACDFIKQGLINVRIESVFYRIWKQLSSDNRQLLIDTYQGDIDKGIDFTLLDEDSNKFKRGQITITEFRQSILDLLK